MIYRRIAGGMLLCAAIALLALAGCSGKDIVRYDYAFAGESENWIGTYKQKAAEIFEKRNGRLEYDKESEGVLSVTYKNDVADFASMRDFAVSYEIGAGGGSETIHYEEGEPRMSEKTYTRRTTGHIAREDDVIKVVISIDGREEAMELKRVE